MKNFIIAMYAAQEDWENVRRFLRDNDFPGDGGGK